MLKPVATTTVSSCEDYIELAELAETINDYLVMFSAGNMVGLVKTIDINVYTTLSLALSRVTNWTTPRIKRYTRPSSIL
jgi:hypothetical protein